MSSYHNSFTYLNQNSQTDFNYIVAVIDADHGEVDSFLSQEQVYADSYKGTKRRLYGTKYNNVALIKITIVKCNGADFSVEECRKAYRWLTGNQQANWLDLYANSTLQYSFLGTVQDVKPYKLDARTVALTIYFESISPWAYSPLQRITYSFHQNVNIIDGIIDFNEDAGILNIDDNGVLYNTNLMSISNEGSLYVDNTEAILINNETDDLYNYIYLNTVFTNNNSDYLSIKNITTGEETIIKDFVTNEIVTLSAEQFILSDVPNKIFGDSFNFVWPRLVPGVNQFIISGSGSGNVELTYRYPIKIGDCAMDIREYYNDDCGCSDTGGGGTSGDCSVDEQDLIMMLREILI